MLRFLIRRLGVMVLTAIGLTVIVFFLVNLEPNLKKLALNQTHQRATPEEVANWLDKFGYNEPFFERYGQWLGVWPKEPRFDEETGRVLTLSRKCTTPEEPGYYGVLQGRLGCSTYARDDVAGKIGEALGRTGLLMLWVFIVMVPTALVIGVIAGMREGSRTDRTLSAVSIVTTATPEYVSGVMFSVIFASWLGVLNASARTASSGDVTFENFALPVMTIAIYGMGYIARMTRASMTEVMTQQYIRTARLKGLKFRSIIWRHALRNALIAPFTVIMLQFPWLLTGVVIVEFMFSYQGFGFLLYQAADSNDIDLLLACAMVSVVLVLATQLISDIGYVYLNPRIRVS